MPTPERDKRWSADEGFSIPTRPEDLKRAELLACALQLRKAGWTFRQVAAALKQPVKRIRNLVLRALRRQGEIIARTSREQFVLMLEQLDELHRALYPRAMAGSDRAAEQLMRIQDHRAKLMGFYAPTKVHQEVDATIQALPDHELLARAREIGLSLPGEPPRGLPTYLPGEELFSVPDAEVVKEEVARAAADDPEGPVSPVQPAE